MSNGGRILTKTRNKIMIRYGELTRILNSTEIQQWHHILEKIRNFEEREAELLRRNKGEEN